MPHIIDPLPGAPLAKVDQGRAWREDMPHREPTGTQIRPTTFICGHVTKLSLFVAIEALENVKRHGWILQSFPTPVGVLYLPVYSHESIANDGLWTREESLPGIQDTYSESIANDGLWTREESLPGIQDTYSSMVSLSCPRHGLHQRTHRPTAWCAPCSRCRTIAGPGRPCRAPWGGLRLKHLPSQ